MAVTRAEVAKRAGVSPAVVSYVLNPGTRSVSAAARARVEEAIATLGYRPNLLAQSLRRSTSQTLGLLIPELHGPTVGDFTGAIEDLAYDLGYVLMIATTGYQPDREDRYLRSFVDRRVDGLIVVGHEPTALLREIANGGTAVILAGNVMPGTGISSVSPEGVISSAVAVDHLMSVHGHRRIGCITGPEESQVLSLRSDGWRLALEKAGLPVDPSLLQRCDIISQRSGFEATESLLALPEPPTALFFTTEAQALGGAAAVIRNGMRVGQDVGIVTFGGSVNVSNTLVNFTTVNAHLDDFAKVVMTRLLEKISRKNSGESHDSTPTDLLIGTSCGCTPERLPGS
ncbi:MAG: LacI family DNA-binding transcriptional regulator [Microbacteriaceae bacterium]|nr:LacI family DNA-binding transcriptional regulator [Microbacteriaceae bacterium]